MEFLYTVVSSVDGILNPSAIKRTLTTDLLHLLFYISADPVLNIYGPSPRSAGRAGGDRYSTAMTPAGSGHQRPASTASPPAATAASHLQVLRGEQTRGRNS